MVIMLKDENGRDVAARVKQRIVEIQKTLRPACASRPSTTRAR